MVGAAGEGRGGGEPGGVGQEPLSFQNLAEADTNARRLSEVQYKALFGEIAATASPLGARMMAAGCAKCAGSFLAAVPMTPAFEVQSSTFMYSLRRYNGLQPVPTPHTHLCGNRGEMRFAGEDSGHLYNCPCLGGNIFPHNAVRDTLAHAIHQCGAASAVPRTEVLIPTPGAPGGQWKADAMFVDDVTGMTYVIDASIVNIDSNTSQRRGGGAEGAEAALRQCEADKRGLPIGLQIQNELGSNTTFVPFVMSSAGGFGPAARTFLKYLYKTSRERGRWLMASGQPQVQASWNTLYASTYWDMRLSMACTATPAEVVGRLVVRDINLNMETDGSRQPLRNPNITAHGRLGTERVAVGDGEFEVVEHGVLTSGPVGVE